MSWTELFERAAAHGVDEAAVRATLAERRAGRGEASGSGDEREEAGTGGGDGDDGPEDGGP